MRINITNKDKNKASIYILKNYYFKDADNNSKRTTKIYKNLGKIKDLILDKDLTYDEIIVWARQEAKRLTEADKKENEDVIIRLHPNMRIDKDITRSFHFSLFIVLTSTFLRSCLLMVLVYSLLQYFVQ